MVCTALSEIIILHERIHFCRSSHFEGVSILFTIFSHNVSCYIWFSSVPVLSVSSSTCRAPCSWFPSRVFWLHVWSYLHYSVINVLYVVNLNWKWECRSTQLYLLCKVILFLFLQFVFFLKSNLSKDWKCVKIQSGMPVLSSFIVTSESVPMIWSFQKGHFLIFRQMH